MTLTSLPTPETFPFCRHKPTCTNCLIVRRPTRDPLPSSAGRATALATRYVCPRDLSNHISISCSVALNSPQTVVGLTTHEQKTIPKGVELGG